MRDLCCQLLLPFALVGILTALRYHADRMAEQEVKLTRESVLFHRYFRAGEDGRVELLDEAAALEVLVLKDVTRRCHAECLWQPDVEVAAPSAVPPP